jgi:hypothetical protein
MSDQLQEVSNDGFVGRTVRASRNNFETAAMYVCAVIAAPWHQPSTDAARGRRLRCVTRDLHARLLVEDQRTALTLATDRRRHDRRAVRATGLSPA